MPAQCVECLINMLTLPNMGTRWTSREDIFLGSKPLLSTHNWKELRKAQKPLGTSTKKKGN